VCRIGIRFELAPDDEGALAFGYSPLLEAVLSLHVLVEPKHHALQHDWVRAARSLRPGLRREIAALSFLYRWTLPNSTLPSARTAYEDFETELARFRSLRTETAAFELLRSLYDHGGHRRPAPRRVLADPAVRTQVLRRASALGYSSRGAVRLLFDDPALLHARLADLLEAYWAEASAAEWERIEPHLADGVAAAGREIAADGVYPFLFRLAPGLRVDLEDSSFGLDLPHDHRVRLDGGSQLLLVPSVYVWPHVRVNCDGPWQLTLVYRAPHLAESLRQPRPPELVRAFRALADPTRLRILQLVAGKPRSTQELAALVRLSEAGTSKHLRVLSAAGLLTRHREGYYVVYSLAPERLRTLGRDLPRLIARSDP
jgi:DNA-binding transcriptional ArsR family regulator